MKQVQRLRRQTLRHIESSESENSSVQLSQKEYLSLKRRAKEGTSLAAWWVSVPMEKKFAAEASRNLESTRLKETRSEKNMSGIRRMEEKKITGDGSPV
ncbi:hypothetical protein POTOM_028130 [Populus tomentosa]|uniref:Uncharacterized protein n=1 Tax=Populus tomentosa TaxID=118781 RepID=A0A8X7ZCU5_POPTO|nr:hypothetical protein POTOM_028130 [Populus tomentosa]